MNKRRLIIGIGNEMRGDDAVGLIVARHLGHLSEQDVSIIEQSGEGAALMACWEGAEDVFLVDAVQSGAVPGTVFRFRAHQESIPTKFFRYSTHNFCVAEAIGMARVLGTLPVRLVVYGIEGKSFETGMGLTPTVTAVIDEVANSICHDLGFADHPTRSEH